MTKIVYIEHIHSRGVGFVKIIGNPPVASGAKVRGYQDWLRRADRRQVTLFPDGKIWCEQQ